MNILNTISEKVIAYNELHRVNAHSVCVSPNDFYEIVNTNFWPDKESPKTSFDIYGAQVIIDEKAKDGEYIIF